MIFHTVSWFIQKWFYPKLIWQIPSDKKIIYLTFDDGPIPEVSDFVLQTLKRFDAKATFFCVGENVRKHPAIFQKIIANGHQIGNHTYNHLVGWKTQNRSYFENINKCQRELLTYWKPKENSAFLFRPPHGRISKSQIAVLRKEYKIIMWNVLTGDYSKEITKEKCLSESIKYSGKGSIVVFHDSLKAKENIEYVLPRYLKHFSELGFRFESIEEPSFTS